MAGAAETKGEPRFILDCSVALSWCFPDERGKAAEGLLSLLAGGAVTVPALWFLELSNALAVGERRGRLSGAETTAALRLLGRLPLEVDGRAGFPLAADLLMLARTHRLSAYDAAYLELALRLPAPLATLDRRLRAAAKAAGVAHYGA